MKKVIAVLAVLLVVAIYAVAHQERDWSKVPLKIEKVAGSVYMLTGSGGNIAFSIGDDGVLMIDDQYLPLASRIRETLKTVTDKPIRFVLNTHYHGDHTGGNEDFGKDATVISHDNVRKWLKSGQPNGPAKHEAAKPEALPVITFDNSLSVHINGEHIKALYFAAGHTDGDSIIFFPEANVVHMGDDFVTYPGMPFVDADAGGSVQGMIENAEKAMASVPDDVKVIPGHGPLCTKADVKKFTDMLKEMIITVSGMKKKGMTAEQVKQANPLKKWDPDSKGWIKADDFAAQIWRELDTRNPAKAAAKPVPKKS
jgi:cyclase